ncbi:MAG: 23S rRNA (pseudouridine(1915)-N(3))-methyltransferase RlmH [Methanolinea sp.]|jgi:23S rRNA (pseudouridine1915-N3)-methyltransferase|nr:23S rRNA (pseudouridine(1915)-N(3))-methyltransferase RlmH [Methanolinea sp.]
MQIRIVGVGKVREPYLQDGLREYCTRIQPYFRVEIFDVREEKIPVRLTPGERAAILEREGDRMLSVAPGSGIMVVLDVRGETWSSEELAAHLGSWVMEGRSNISFLIGGPLGISGRVRDLAQHTLSLSRMTFPHQMVRLILLEQLFRAARMYSGEPYHK